MSEATERVLIVYVEDNVETLNLVKVVLESTGRYKVEGAPDGLAGLELVRKIRPTLVLIDLDLPFLDGLELARRLRSDPEPFPMVAVSASVMNQERQRSLDAGCMSFVEKPFDIKVLREVVERCLRATAAFRRTDK